MHLYYRHSTLHFFVWHPLLCNNTQAFFQKYLYTELLLCLVLTSDFQHSHDLSFFQVFIHWKFADCFPCNEKRRSTNVQLCPLLVYNTMASLTKEFHFGFALAVSRTEVSNLWPMGRMRHVLVTPTFGLAKGGGKSLYVMWWCHDNASLTSQSRNSQWMITRAVQ